MPVVCGISQSGYLRAVDWPAKTTLLGDLHVIDGLGALEINNYVTVDESDTSSQNLCTIKVLVMYFHSSVSVTYQT